MRYTTILAVLAAAVVVVAKRRKKVEVTLESIPECAKPCIKKAIRDKTTCSDADYRCICRRDNFAKIQGTSVMCVVRECGYEVALDEVLPILNEFCGKKNDYERVTVPE